MRTARRVLLSEDARTELREILERSDTPSELRLRVRIVCMAAEGLSDARIAAAVGLSEKTVGRWRKRYLKTGVSGFRASRPAAPRRTTIPEETVRRIVQRTLHERPPHGLAWTSRAMAAVTGVSEASVRRIWREHVIRPGARPALARATEESAQAGAGWYPHGVYLSGGDRILILVRKRQANEAPAPENLLPNYGKLPHRSRVIVLVRLLLARSVQTIGDAGDALRQYLYDSVPDGANLQVLIVAEGATAAVQSRLRISMKGLPVATLAFVASHGEWAQLLESVAAIAEESGEDAASEAVLELGRSIASYILLAGESSGRFAWCASREAKSKTAHAS